MSNCNVKRHPKNIEQERQDLGHEQVSGPITSYFVLSKHGFGLITSFFAYEIHT
jgi:hypothetical protein